MDRFARVVFLQPAFLGDVVLSTALLESWHRRYPDHRLEILVRKEAQGFFEGHPFLDHVHVWDRSGWAKYLRLANLSKEVRRHRPNVVINLHRHASMAFLAARSGAVHRFAFNESVDGYNPITQTAVHGFGDGRHETERNHGLVTRFIGPWNAENDRPKLHPSDADLSASATWPKDGIILAPSSVWMTKRWPVDHWSSLADAWLRHVPSSPIILLGSAADRSLLEAVRDGCREARPHIVAGELNLLAAAALMRQSSVVVSNDSAPLHMAGAVGAPVVGVFCSTSPRFGFGPVPALLNLGKAAAVEVSEHALDCKPCGPHGHAACPLQHFSCGWNLDVNRVLEAAISVSNPLRESLSPS